MYQRGISPPKIATESENSAFSRCRFSPIQLSMIRNCPCHITKSSYNPNMPVSVGLPLFQSCPSCVLRKNHYTKTGQYAQTGSPVRWKSAALFVFVFPFLLSFQPRHVRPLTSPNPPAPKLDYCAGAPEPMSCRRSNLKAINGDPINPLPCNPLIHTRA